MKEYWNCDIETSGLIEDMKKQDHPVLHNFCAIHSVTDEVKLFSRSKGNLHELQDFLNTGDLMAIHNGTVFDLPALTFLGYDVSKMNLLDTLPLSYYLEPRVARHGLEHWGEQFGVPKPYIADWSSLTPEEYDHRVIEDCKIQKRLTKHLLTRLDALYDSKEGKERVLNLLSWKMQMQAIQQEYRWHLDVEGAKALVLELQTERDKRLAELQASMPKKKVMAWKERPKKPFLKTGALSATGLRWKEVCDANGIDFESKERHKVWTGVYEEPNAGSPEQLKSWLYSLGWVPQTFEFKRNKETGEVKQIPQINGDDGVCISIKNLIKKHPNIGLEALEGLGVIKHRLGVVNGFLNNCLDDGTIVAWCAGFTNTLRLKHAGLVNLPSTRVPYGERIRALLTAPQGFMNIGSDLSSLEDRCKHHFMWKFDPEYVKTQMHPDFDPHLSVAVAGGLMTSGDVDMHKLYKATHGAEGKDFSHIRHMGKGANYGAQYGIGVESLARQLGCDEVTSKKVLDGYWALNWSIRAIAKAATVKQVLGESWIFNPVSKIWYWLKADKDRFSTLCQGLGAYIFDMWCKGINDSIKARYGRSMPFVAQFHDELILMVKEGTLPFWEGCLKDAIHNLSDTLKLNRDLDCDVQAGKNYSEIH